MTDHEPRRHLLPTLALLLFGGVCISWAPSWSRWLPGRTWGPTSIAFWRLLTGAVTLFAAAALTGRPLLLPPRAGAAGLPGRGHLHGRPLPVAPLDQPDRRRAWRPSSPARRSSTRPSSTGIFVGEKPRGRFFVAAAAGLLGVALLAGVGSDIALHGRLPARRAAGPGHRPRLRLLPADHAPPGPAGAAAVADHDRGLAVAGRGRQQRADLPVRDTTRSCRARPPPGRRCSRSASGCRPAAGGPSPPRCRACAGPPAGWCCCCSRCWPRCGAGCCSASAWRRCSWSARC